jgi:hypothetical protein
MLVGWGREVSGSAFISLLGLMMGGAAFIFQKWLNRELVSVTNNIELQTQVTDTISPSTLPIIENMEGQENPTDSWWQKIKSQSAKFMERIESDVEAAKKFLSTLTSDERWGLMVAFEEAQPSMFSQLVAEAPDWVEWMA